MLKLEMVSWTYSEMGFLNMFLGGRKTKEISCFLKVQPGSAGTRSNMQKKLKAWTSVVTVNTREFFEERSDVISLPESTLVSASAWIGDYHNKCLCVRVCLYELCVFSSNGTYFLQCIAVFMSKRTRHAFISFLLSCPSAAKKIQLSGDSVGRKQKH